jgi:hypothetical protein
MGVAIGTFVLHRYCGDEIYTLREPELRAYLTDDGIALSFQAHTAPEPIQTMPDTAALRARPHAGVTVVVPALDPGGLVGARLSVPHGSDERGEDHVATLYYCEHEDLDGNVLEILSRHDDIFRVRWTGVTTDVNYYDGSKPATRVEIDGFFRFKGMREWLVSTEGSEA